MLQNMAEWKWGSASAQLWYVSNTQYNQELLSFIPAHAFTKLTASVHGTLFPYRKAATVLNASGDVSVGVEKR